MLDHYLQGVLAMMNRRRAWMAVVAAAVAVGGCGRGGQAEKTDQEQKTPAAKTVEPDKTGAAAAPTHDKGESPVSVQTKPGTVADKGPGPLVTLRLSARGLGAEEVEKLIAAPLEASLKGLKGLRSLRSMSQEGRAVLWVEFTAGTDADVAAVAVRDAANGALGKLPEDVDPPIVFREPDAGSFTVLTLSAARDRSPAEIRMLADEAVRRQLETVPHVARVAVIGGSVPRCWVVPSPERLAAHAITLVDLAQALDKAAAAGEAGKPGAAGKLTAPEDLDLTIVATREGQPIRVRDVAKVEMSGRLRPGDSLPLTLPPDAPRAAVFLAASRLDGTTDQEFGRDLNKRIEDIRQTLPPEVKLDRGVPAALAPIVHELLVRLQDGLPPGLRLQAETSEKWGTMLVPESPAPLVVKVQGGDLTDVQKTAFQLAADLRKVPGVADVAVAPLAAAEPQLRVDIDREKAAKLGVTVADIARTLEVARGGRIVGRLYSIGDRQLDIVLAGEDGGPNALADLHVPTPKGERVRLANVTKIEAVAAAPAIYRENAARTVLVLCRVKDRPAAEVAADVRRTIDAVDGAATNCPPAARSASSRVRETHRNRHTAIGRRFTHPTRTRHSSSRFPSGSRQ